MLTCPHCSHPLILLSAADPDHARARTSVAELSERLRQYLATVRSTDVKLAAAHLFSDDPSRADIERVRRLLDRMTRAGELVHTTLPVAGWNGGRMAVYRLHED